MASPRSKPNRRRGQYDDQHRWKLSLLREFVAKRGWSELRRDTIVPPGVRLYPWAHNRRQDYRAGVIADWLVRELERIPGWSWAPKRERLTRIVDDLRSFGRKKGWDALTDDVMIRGVAMLEWVANRRSEYRRGVISKPLARALEALPGWTWEPRQARHVRTLQALKKHVARHGWHEFRLETRAPTGERIGRWANHARILHRRKELPTWLVWELESIRGWTWEPRVDRQSRNIELLREFLSTRGRDALHVDTVFRGVKLGAWYFRCRFRASRGDISPQLSRQISRVDPRWRSRR